MKDPGTLRLGNRVNATVKAIFNQAQPAGRTYGMLVQMHQKGGGLFQYAIRLPVITVAEGRAVVEFEDDFSRVDKSFILGPSDTDGNSYYFCCLAYLVPAGDFSPQDEWKALSPFCAWRIVP